MFKTFCSLFISKNLLFKYILFWNPFYFNMTAMKYFLLFSLVSNHLTKYVRRHFRGTPCTSLLLIWQGHSGTLDKIYLNIKWMFKHILLFTTTKEDFKQFMGYLKYSYTPNFGKGTRTIKSISLILLLLLTDASHGHDDTIFFQKVFINFQID